MNTESTTEAEKIEGIEKAEDSDWGGYPIETMLIRNEPRTVHDVLRRIGKKMFVMDPDFQRDFIWSAEKQSKLIESVIMRIPLPVFYLAENPDGKMIVVDGLQRLTTFENFVKNEFRLKLPLRPELNGKSFEDLSPKLQNRIEDCQLILYIIDSKVPPQALLDIFERVNGGVPLTRQQMRNCLYMGSATQFLKAEARTNLFRKATGYSLKQDTMRDREMVNRFCAFTIFDLNEYKGDMDDFLARTLQRMNKDDFDQNIYKSLSNNLRISLKNNLTVFGSHAFRKFDSNKSSRSIFNASLWDVMSTLMAFVPEAVAEENADEIRDQFQQLMNDAYFYDTITLGTSQVNRVKDRFEMAREILKDYMDA